MKTITELTDNNLKFRDARDWKQFHTPKDLAISLVLESTEFLEHFQRKTDQEIKEYVKTHKEALSDELADVLNYVLILAHDLNIDLPQATKSKIKKNEQKYPVEKAKGKKNKYTEL